MSDNPFAEPDDGDRTVIRPSPGGRAAPAPPPRQAPAETRANGFGAFDAAPAGDGVEITAPGQEALLVAAAPLLQLLARLRNTVRQPDAGSLRERAVQALRLFEQQARTAGVPLEQLRPAHYALCASLDDVVLNTPWGGAGGWDAQSLVSTFHQEVRSGERFFDLLNQLRQNPGTSLAVLELMYICLSLGMQGRYRLSPRGPAELERLREEVYATIRRQRPAPDAALSVQWQGVAAPYRPRRASLPVWVAGSVALAAFGGLFAWASFGLGTASDSTFQAMLAAPPAAMPAISRVGPVQPPPPAPPPPEPGVLDRLRSFLAPEIKEGLVAVLGTDATPIVRLRSSGLFASGSASLQPRVLPLLARVGTALRTDPGAVSVIGYTDNQPIHTVQFPSNFELSSARAAAAAGPLAQAAGDASRFRNEGRADADPIASNATPDGRDQNRRIEIVLQRQGSAG